MFRSVVHKIRNLAEILDLPGGLRLKLAEPDFHWRDLRMCHRLRSSGIVPRSILDVGANVGQFALAAKSVYPGARIHSFEPVPGAFAALKKLCARHPSIVPYNMALGAKPGQATLHVTNHSQSSSFLHLHRNHKEAYPHVTESAEVVAEVSTLAMELERIRPEPPILLKIDTQGFEAPVLSGAGSMLSQVRWILFETSTRPMYEGEVLFDPIKAMLESQQFRFCGPVEIHLDPGGAPVQFDALFEQAASGDKEG